MDSRKGTERLLLNCRAYKTLAAMSVMRLFISSGSDLFYILGLRITRVRITISINRCRSGQTRWPIERGLRKRGWRIVIIAVNVRRTLSRFVRSAVTRRHCAPSARNLSVDRRSAWQRYNSDRLHVYRWAWLSRSAAHTSPWYIVSGNYSQKKTKRQVQKE